MHIKRGWFYTIADDFLLLVDQFAYLKWMIPCCWLWAMWAPLLGECYSIGSIWAMLGLLGGILRNCRGVVTIRMCILISFDDGLKGWNARRTWGECGAKLWHTFRTWDKLGAVLGLRWDYAWANVGRVEIRSLLKCCGVVMTTVQGLKCTWNWGWTWGKFMWHT
jgi:hypothetical protein